MMCLPRTHPAQRTPHISPPSSAFQAATISSSHLVLGLWIPAAVLIALEVDIGSYPRSAGLRHVSRLAAAAAMIGSQRSIV